jgi:peptidyl-prolyl cis-trans isomerase C
MAMVLGEKLAREDPAFNYHLLRSALDHCKRNLSALDGEQFREVRSKAERSYRLESLVLTSPEAKGLVIAEAQLDAAVSEVAGRYPSADDFEDDLGTNGLDRDVLRDALRRELIFDAVMQRVGAKAPDINEIDLRLFFEMHSDRFEFPELRRARHILISINPEFQENTRPAALARAETLTSTLRDKPNRFPDLARRCSECPTAMEGGKLGEVRRGTLYPELDEALFNLAEGEISDIVESEIGFHILLCEKIKSGRRIPFSKAAPRIREILEARRRRNCQKAFLARLQQDKAS